MTVSFRPRPWPRRWPRHLGVLALFLGLTVVLTWPLARSLGSAIPGDSFDGWQNYWNLWWVRRSLLELHTHPYFTTDLYHPGGVALWFQTLNVFNGLTSLPVQLAGNLFRAYNAVVLFSFTMAGYGATLLSLHVLRRAGGRRNLHLWSASVVAGVIFTFAPFHFAHLLGHMQVFSLQFIPFYVLYLLRAALPGAGNVWRRAVPLALFLILAGLCDWYAVLYLGVFTVLYLVWQALHRQLHRPLLLAVALAALIFLMVTAPLLAPMVRESLAHDFMRPPSGQIADLSADLLAFAIPSGQHPLWGDWAAQTRSVFPSSPAENTVYLGLVPVLLAGYGLVRRQLRRLLLPKLAAGFWVLTAAVFALFSLGPVLHIGGRPVLLPGGQPVVLPYALLLRLPFFEIARTVARYDLMVMLALAVLAAAGLYLLLDRFTSPAATAIVAAAAVGLVLFEFLPAPYPVSPPDTPAWYRTLAEDPRSGAVMNVPMSWDRPNYLLHQTVHGKPLTAGYISREDPRTLPGRVPVLSDFRYNGPDINAVDAAAFAPTLFDFAGIRWVAVDRYQMPPGGQDRAANEALLASIFAGRQPVFEDERLTVYETWPPDPRLAFIELGADWGQRQLGPVRAVIGAASVVVHSPDAAVRTLLIDAAGDTSYRLLDAGGQTVGTAAAGSGSADRFVLELVPGPNSFTLQTDQPGLLVRSIRLE